MRLDRLRETSPLLMALSNTEVSLFEAAASEQRLKAGEIIFDEAGSADRFYVVMEGKVGLELTAPGKDPISIQTLGPGDLVGVSWLFPPHRWNWRARAVVDTELAAFDAILIREHLSKNRDLALEVLTVVSAEIAERLHRTRIQLLDLYRGRST